MRLAFKHRLCIYIAKLYWVCLLSWKVSFQVAMHTLEGAQRTMHKFRKAAQRRRHVHLFKASGESSMHKLKAAGQCSKQHVIQQCEGPYLQFEAPRVLAVAVLLGAAAVGPVSTALPASFNYWSASSHAAHSSPCKGQCWAMQDRHVCLC